MIKKKLLSSIMALSMLVGMYTPCVYAKPLDLTANKNSARYVRPNIDAIIKLLKRTGKLNDDSTPEEVKKAIMEYCNGLTKEDVLPKDKIERNKKILQNVNENGVRIKRGESKDNYSKAQKNGDMRTDNVLVVLMEFPNLKHNNIPEESEAYMKDYSKEHYTNMLFGADTFKGPKDKDYATVKKYYEAQSGGEYSIDGDVYGWYKADHEAEYYGKDEGKSHNVNANVLVREAIKKLVKNNPNIDLSKYDKFNRATGKMEPDGVIDRFMVIYSGIGQEADGGVLGKDAIWSHSSGIFPLETVKDNNEKEYKVCDYTMEAENGMPGLFCHEFAHDIGIPDDYDRTGDGGGDAIETWSLMSYGSWAGAVGGTEPTSISPWGRQYYTEALNEPGWLQGSNVNITDIHETGMDFTLNQASIKGNNDDVVRINLPTEEVKVKEDIKGEYSYFSGEVDMNEAYLKTVNPIEVTSPSALTLKMSLDYDTELGWDYFYVQAKLKDSNKWINLKDNEGKNNNDIPDKEAPKFNRGNGYTGSSQGWTNVSFDLAQVVTGSSIKYSVTSPAAIELRFNYATDPGAHGKGVYIDDIKVVDDKKVIFADDAEGDEKNLKFKLSEPIADFMEGDVTSTCKPFTRSNGTKKIYRYYLVELRSHNGNDEGLKHGYRDLVSYDPGIVIWYIDTAFDSNDDVAYGKHPGECLNAVVDAGQSPIIEKKANGKLYAFHSVFQMHDAAFGIKNSSKFEYKLASGSEIYDIDNYMHPIFEDSRDYSNKYYPESGRKVPNLGLKIYVTQQAKDSSSATIHITK